MNEPQINPLFNGEVGRYNDPETQEIANQMHEYAAQILQAYLKSLKS
jgi:hypothetical protein